jgi:hypothetical protein
MNMQMSPPPGGDPIGLLMVVLGVTILLVSVFLAIKATLHPGEAETEPQHPKNVILGDDR